MEECNHQWHVHSVLVRPFSFSQRLTRTYRLFIDRRFFFATILSLYNKWMFSPEHFGFPYPLFVTTLHMFVQFAIAAFLRFTWPRHFKPDRRPNARDYG